MSILQLNEWYIVYIFDQRIYSDFWDLEATIYSASYIEIERLALGQVQNKLRVWL